MPVAESTKPSTRGFFGSRASLRAERDNRLPPARTRGFFGSRASLRDQRRAIVVSDRGTPRLLREPRFVEGRSSRSCCPTPRCRPAASSGAALR